MHVLHVSQHCHLASPFGTERYQRDLILEAGSQGVRGTLLWLGARPAQTTADAAVRVVPLSAESPARLQAEVTAVLEADPPAVIHFHSIGQAEAVVAKLARARRIPYVYTYHTPWALCANGSLLRWGSTPCDGEVRAGRCSACKVVSLLRAPRTGLRWERMLTWSVGRAQAAMVSPGMRWWVEAIREFLGHCERAFAHAEPARGVLLANGVRPAALVVCPPGVSGDFAQPTLSRRTCETDTPFVVGYIGRLDRLKGFDILVDAFMRTTWPEARLRLVGGPHDELRAVAYARCVMERARRDRRISFVDAQPLGLGAALYRDLSLLAIPSVGIETGPLVLREALQFGLPVLATNRLGEPHLARAYARIVEPNTVAGWAQVLEGVFDDARRGVFPVARQLAASEAARRTMRDVARDVIGVYDALLAGGEGAVAAASR